MTAAQQELRTDLRAWLVANLPWEYGTEPPARSQDLAEVVAFGRHWQSMLAAGRWVGVTWPEELRRAGTRRHRALRGDRGDGPGSGSRAGRSHRDQPGQPHPVRPRHGGAAGALAPAHPRGRGAVVPAVQRARGGQRPGLTDHPGREGSRWVPGHRAQGVDLLCPVRRLGTVPGPQRARRPQAPVGHLLVGHRHARRRRRGPASRADHRGRRVQRGHPGRGLRTRRTAHRGGGQRMVGGQLHPVPRAGGQSPTTRDPRPAAGRAARAGRRAAGARWLFRPRRCGNGWPRPTSRSSCSSCTTGGRSPGWNGASTPGPRAAPSSCTGARCPSASTRRS